MGRTFYIKENIHWLFSSSDIRQRESLHSFNILLFYFFICCGLTFQLSQALKVVDLQLFIEFRSSWITASLPSNVSLHALLSTLLNTIWTKIYYFVTFSPGASLLIWKPWFNLMWLTVSWDTFLLSVLNFTFNVW